MVRVRKVSIEFLDEIRYINKVFNLRTSFN
jgi:hypothetical protein